MTATDRIRAALESAMCGEWGKQDALAALGELEAALAAVNETIARRDGALDFMEDEQKRLDARVVELEAERDRLCRTIDALLPATGCATVEEAVAELGGGAV